jgi:hypothetical protein
VLYVPYEASGCCCPLEYVVLEGEGLIEPDAEPSDWLGAWLYGEAMAWGRNSGEARVPGCCEVKQLALLWVERNLVFFAVTEDLV